MNSEQNLTREEAIAILNTPDEQLNELIGPVPPSERT